MNIIYYLGAFPKLSESFVLNEIVELTEIGHNVAVCSLNKPEEHVFHDEVEELDIPIHYVETPTYSDITALISPKALHPRILKGAFYRAPPNHHASNLFRARQTIEFVDSLDWEPDHLHTHFVSLSKFGARYVSNYYEVPFTITAHAFGLFKEPLGTWTGKLLASADRVITISEYNRQHIRNQFKPKTPIDIVRAGIRPAKFVPSDTTVPNRVLSIARFVEKKGLTYALDAIAIAAAHRPDISYHLIGSGELEQQLKQKTKQLDIEENVQLLDNVSDGRLINELDEARCFLLPSVIAQSGDRDGIPVSLMEAMAMKTPPISTTVSGIPELIDDGSDGLLVEPRNPDAIAEAMLTLLECDSKWSAYSDSARKKVFAKFNIEIEVRKLETAFTTAGST